MYQSIIGNSSVHIDEMKTKGMKWKDRLTTRKLHPRDAWFSFFAQLFPAMSWGLVTVVMDPDKLEEMMDKFALKNDLGLLRQRVDKLESMMSEIQKLVT